MGLATGLETSYNLEMQERSVQELRYPQHRSELLQGDGARDGFGRLKAQV